MAGIEEVGLDLTRCRNTVENALEGDPRKFRIAMLTGPDDPLDLADGGAADKDNMLLSEARIEVVLCYGAVGLQRTSGLVTSTDCQECVIPVQTNQTQMTAFNSFIVIRKAAIVGMKFRRVKHRIFWKVH
jgi:hypothetical protein